jgi:hypothetical protein
MMKTDFRKNYDLKLPYDTLFILFFKFYNFMIIIKAIIIHWYNFFSEAFENIFERKNWIYPM